MKRLTSNLYYALNDRTIDLLMKGDIDMTSTTETLETYASDAEVKALMLLETEVEIFVVAKNKTRAGGAFFNCLNNTFVDCDEYGVLKKS